MRVSATVLGVTALACVAGGCRRAPLHEETGTGVLPDAGGVPGMDARGADGASPIAVDAFSADHAVDEPMSEGGIFIGPTIDTCPSAPPSHGCPIDRPTAGAPCAALRAVCEYGGDDVACRDRWRCSDEGTWVLSTPGCADRCPATR